MTIDDYLYSQATDPEFDGDTDRENTEDDASDPWPSLLPPAQDRPVSLVCADGVSRSFALAPCDLAGGRKIAQRVQREAKP